jgi:hypothetical protein
VPQNVTHFLAAPEILGGKETDAGLRSSISRTVVLCKTSRNKASGFGNAARITQGRDTVRKCQRPRPWEITINWIRAYENTAHWIERIQNSTRHSDPQPAQILFRPVRRCHGTCMDCWRATPIVIAIVMAAPFTQADPLFPGGWQNQILKNE